MARRINVEALRAGMYVEKLDRPWLETPFPLQGVAVESDDEVVEIKRYCRFVYIRDDSVNDEVELSKSRFSRPQQRAFSKQLFDSRKHYQRTKGVVFGLHKAIRAGRRLDARSVQDVVSDLLPKIVRSTDALVWLTQLNNKAEYVANHSINVCILSLIFGKYLGLSDDELMSLGAGALMHDIGKIQVPGSILKKSGKLSESELAIIRKHPTLGAEIISRTKEFDVDIANVALMHHEWFAGGGYPNGMRLTQPENLYSQIVAIADVYDAVSSDRPYRKALPTDQAIRILKEGRSKQFHPDLLDAFIQCFGYFPSGTLVKLSSGEVGIKMFSSDDNHQFPVILVIMDKHMRKRFPFKIIDFKLFKNMPNAYSIVDVLSPTALGINFADYVDEVMAL